MYNPVELLVLIFNLTTAASQGKSSPFSLQSLRINPFFLTRRTFRVSPFSVFIFERNTGSNITWISERGSDQAADNKQIAFEDVLHECLQRSSTVCMMHDISVEMFPCKSKHTSACFYTHTQPGDDIISPVNCYRIHDEPENLNQDLHNFWRATTLFSSEMTGNK